LHDQHNTINQKDLIAETLTLQGHLQFGGLVFAKKEQLFALLIAIEIPRQGRQPQFESILHVWLEWKLILDHEIVDAAVVDNIVPPP
jgi:hypothetical protein